MNKTLTIKVPNELWVNEFDKNLTKTYEYNGPATFWIVSKDENIAPTAYENEPETIEKELKHYINLDSATDEELALAIMIVHGAEAHEFIYSDEINHDGSIYKKIENPRLEDFYAAKFVEGKVVLEVIVKDPTLPNEQIAIERRDYVLKYTSTFDFDAEQKAKIDDFLSKINAYLETMKTVYPWKYVTIDKNEVPKIPLSLVQLFNSLPEIT